VVWYDLSVPASVWRGMERSRAASRMLATSMILGSERGWGDLSGVLCNRTKRDVEEKKGKGRPVQRKAGQGRASRLKSAGGSIVNVDCGPKGPERNLGIALMDAAVAKDSTEETEKIKVGYRRAGSEAKDT